MIRAIWLRNVDRVQQLLDGGADPNCTDSGVPALVWAIGEGPDSAELVEELLEAGADPTPGLSRATFEGQEQLVRELVERGADVNAGDDDGDTPLMMAAKYGATAVARLLLQRGAFVHAKDREGRTALHWAAARGDFVETVEVLLKAGADIDAQSTAGTALAAAAFIGALGTVHALIRAGADVARPDPTLNATPLMFAAERGQEPVVAALLAAHASVNQRDGAGWTALFYAAREDHAGIVRRLIAAGADVSARADDLTTAMALAADNDNPEVVAILEQAGARG